jgi:hypothetical protein
MNEEEEQNFEDETELRAEINQEVMEGYGAPTGEEKINQHTIFKKALENKDTIRTTYLTKGELGKPLFSVRFYLNCLKISKRFNAREVDKYFLEKIRNITDSGMSNEGFLMKLNVSNRKQVTRKTEKKESELKGETF